MVGAEGLENHPRFRDTETPAIHGGNKVVTPQELKAGCVGAVASSQEHGKHTASTPETQKTVRACVQGVSGDLRAVIEAWDTLPEAVKAGIVAMVKAAKQHGA